MDERKDAIRNWELGIRNGSGIRSAELKDGELQRRTKAFALQAIKFVESLPPSRATEVLGKQLLRSATSVGANYRAACRARSKADFVNKLAMVEEEADESSYWLELLAEAAPVQSDLTSRLSAEASEITAMVVASIKSFRIRQ